MHWNRYRILHKKQFVISAIWGCIVLVLGILSGLWIRPFLFLVAENAQPSPDLILDAIPTISTNGIVVWGPVIIGIAFIVHLAIYPQAIPLASKAVGILYFVRSCFLFLTPLGSHPGQRVMESDSFWGGVSYNGLDYFFSGHVAFPCILAFIFWKLQRVRTFYLISAVVMAISVLLEHIHYSIDVFVAPFMAWGVWSFCREFFQRDVTLLEQIVKD